MVFIGLLIGGNYPWLFCSLTITQLLVLPAQLLKEVRRQFRIPGIIDRTVKPDYQRAVDICTYRAQENSSHGAGLL